MKNAYKIVLVMLGSLSLPLAGAFARVATQADVTNMQSGESANLTGQAADEQALKPLRNQSKKKSSKKSKKSKKSSKKKSSKSPSKKGKN